ncbi:MAG: AtpZ/AtpI family protein [Thermodesulfobacteriota bacterium]
MSDATRPPRSGPTVFPRRVGRREKRRLAREREPSPAAWWGLSAIGTVGWIVALPALAGGFLGRWLDRSLPQRFSWTLMLLFAGLLAGCLLAWLWVRRQRGSILRSRPEDDDAA